MTLPKAVLDAGRIERERYIIRHSFGSYRVMDDSGRLEVFHGDEDDCSCRDFIDDRVFRSMLRALAKNLTDEVLVDADETFRSLSPNFPPSDDDSMAQTAHTIENFLLSLAEDDHGG